MLNINVMTALKLTFVTIKAFKTNTTYAFN